MATPWQQISNQIQPYLIYPKGERLGASTSQGDPYFASGNWRLNRDEVMRFVARVERAVREVGATMLPLKIIDSPIDIEDFRDAKRGGAPEMAFRHPDVVKQVGDVVPLVFIRGMGGYAGSDRLAVREGGFGSVLGDVAIEALAGFSGETAGQVLTGFPLAAPHAQMGSVLHELTHYLYDEDHRPEGFEAITPFDKIMMNYEEYFPSSEFVEDKEPRISSLLTPITDKEGDGIEEKRDKASNISTAGSDVMAVSARQFANEFSDSDYRNPDFWRGAVQDGSISSTRTSRASVEVRGPRTGRTYWVQPGEVSNLRAQGFTIGSAPQVRTQEEMLAEARRLNPNMDDPLDRNFRMPDASQLEQLSVAHPDTVTGLAGSGTTWEAMHQGLMERILARIKKGDINSEEEAWQVFKAGMGGLQYESQETVDRWKNDFLSRADYKEASKKWADPGYLSPGDQKAIDGWTLGLDAGSLTVDDVKRLIEQQGRENFNNPDAMIAALEAIYGPGTKAPETGAPETGAQEGLPVGDADVSWFSERWGRGHYNGNQEQLIADMSASMQLDPIQAKSLFTMKRLEGFFQGDGMAAAVDPAVLSNRPQAGRFSQFAEFRKVDPELGGPALRELQRQFEPLERGYKAYDALRSIIDPTPQDQEVGGGYTAPTFSDYLQRRGGSLQSARMGSYDILRRLGEMTARERADEGLLFGNVYGEQGDLLTRGIKGFTGTQMDQAIQDAASAQYGRRGGEFVGGQLGRQRQLFEAQQQSPSGAEATNFFDYIRTKYGLQF
jgi:hypothetical protein